MTKPMSALERMIAESKSGQNGEALGLERDKMNEGERSILTLLRQSKDAKLTSVMAEKLYGPWVAAEDRTPEDRAEITAHKLKVRNDLRRLVRENFVDRLVRSWYIAHGLKPKDATALLIKEERGREKERAEGTTTSTPRPRKKAATKSTSTSKSNGVVKNVKIDRDETVSKKDIQAQTKRLFGALTEEGQIIVAAFHFGPSNRRVAKTTGVSVGKAKRRMDKIGRGDIYAAPDKLTSVMATKWMKLIENGSGAEA